LTKLELHLKVSDGSIKAVDFISQNSQFSKGMVKKIMLKGAVWWTRQNSTKRLRRSSKDLSNDDQIHLYYDEAILNQIPNVCRLIADEDKYSVWFKPYGTFSQGSKYGDHCTINRWSEQHLKPERNAFIVHRLDRAAQGLILLAHSRKAAATFSELFKQRKINKTYKVVVHGEVKLTEHQPIKMDTPLDGKNALSFIHHSNYDESKNQSTLAIEIHTGRKHQIRQHMALMGHPVVGDRLYGPENSNIDDLQLTAYKLEFTCPFSGKTKKYSL